MNATSKPTADASTGCWAACTAIAQFAPEFHGDIASNCPGEGACMARRLLDTAARLQDTTAAPPASSASPRR